VVYVGGFPPPFVVEFLATLAAGADKALFRHWGDADNGGLQIWWLLRERLARPVHLFRTTASWIGAGAEQPSRLLSQVDRAALGRLHARLDAMADAPDVVEVRELITALLESGIKPEQESFR
jgi:hypothetical protein